LQQSDVTLHCWPYHAHTFVPLACGTSTQVPVALPAVVTQKLPGQQSAVAVHAEPPSVAPLLTHVGPGEQMYGGTPLGFGTHGRLLQQFALDAHDWPGAAQVVPLHRGTPLVSTRHVSWMLQFPLQQSQAALQLVVANLQMSPSGLQPCGLRQVPTVAGAMMSQVAGVELPPGRPAAPQQSVSRWHTSPTAWHALEAKQTSAPVGP
jgi:hypothetical protein